MPSPFWLLPVRPPRTASAGPSPPQALPAPPRPSPPWGGPSCPSPPGAAVIRVKEPQAFILFVKPGTWPLLAFAVKCSMRHLSLMFIPKCLCPRSLTGPWDERMSGPLELLLTGFCAPLAQVQRLGLLGSHDRASTRDPCFQTQLLSRSLPAEVDSPTTQHLPR